MSERFYVEQPIADLSAVLVDAQAQHLVKVMRATTGDQVILFDGSGAEFAAKIARISKTTVDLEILERREISRELSVEVTVGVAPPQGGRQKRVVAKRSGGGGVLVGAPRA